jgi:lysylphosphatidylglycerol synthetase-like protein (DUF2156 family)
MFCNNCGTENPDDAKFCSNCGAAIVGVVEQEVEPKLELVEVVKAERKLGTKLITGYYGLGAILWFVIGAVGALVIVLNPLSTVAITPAMSDITIFAILASFVLFGTAVNVWKVTPYAWLWALLVAVLVLFSPGPTEWFVLLINVVIVWYVWRNSDASRGCDDDCCFPPE